MNTSGLMVRILLLVVCVTTILSIQGCGSGDRQYIRD